MREKFNVGTMEDTSVDTIELSLRSIAENIIVVAFGILPIFFILVVYAPFDYTKTLLIVISTFVSFIFFSLSVLRSGSLTVAAPWALPAFYLVALITIVSTLLSGDIYDSFIGEVMSVHSAAFILLMAVVMSIPALFNFTKINIMRLYILFATSALFLGIFHLLRIVFGADFLSFAVFTSPTSSPLGGWNDLGLFFGLTILLSLVSLEQLPLTKWGKILFSVVIGVSLLMLSVVNFFAIWIVLALVSLVLLMYTLTKDKFAKETLALQEDIKISLYSITISAVVFVFSLLFIIGGSVVGGFVSNATGISYIEVRPSLQATIDIGRHVYGENAFVGVGPNKFIDAWRLYKDPSINQTIFWATDFPNGNGFITTQFVTGGIFATLAWILFFILFLIAGFRMLFRATYVDRFWYFIGTSSFVAAVYLWSMAFFYNPGSVILLLTSLFSGLVFVSYGMLLGSSGRTFSIGMNRRTGFILVAVVMLIIISSVAVLYYSGRHYASTYTFNGAVSRVGSEQVFEKIEQEIAQAYAIYPNDVFARQLASYQLAKMNSLLGVQNPTPEQQKAFESAYQNGINAAKLAIQKDSNEPANWLVLGSIYSALASVDVEGAKSLAEDAYQTAKKYDPVNPVYLLLQAQLHARTGDIKTARKFTLEAIELKPNYFDALSLLTQLDIAEGKVEDAIKTTRSIITLEPNNPARYYQLGVLESAAKNADNAIAAFQHAITLDENYANARYRLALELIQKGNKEEAISHLEVVEKLNPESNEVKTLLEKLRSGVVQEIIPETQQGKIEEPATVLNDGEDVTSTQKPDDTPLVSTVNTTTDSGSSTKPIQTIENNQTDTQQ